MSNELIEQLHHPPDDEYLHHNQSVVADHYSLQTQGQQLRQVYRLLLEAPIDSSLAAPSNAGIAVDLVSHARPFFPCRTETLNDQ